MFDLEKTDFTTSKELPGARIILKDKSGNIRLKENDRDFYFYHNFL